MRIRAAILFSVLLIMPGLADAVSTSRKGDMLRSALLPGWGQMHMGHSTRGVVFMGVEAVTWIGAGLSYLEGTFNRNDYRWLAMEEAGISISGRSSEFMDDVGDFSSSAEYNDYIHRLARYYYPDDPDAQRDYYESHARYGSDGWYWTSETSRLDYADHLRKSKQWFRRSMYIAAFALVNRVVSVIDTALLDETEPGIYTSLDFPERHDFSSVRFTIGARF